MKFKIIMHRDVSKFLEKHEDLRPKLIEILKQITVDNVKGNHDIKKMQGFKDTYRLRISKYRFIFAIIKNQLIIFVSTAGSRGDVYKK